LRKTLLNADRVRMMPLPFHEKNLLAARIRILWNQLFIGQMSEQEVLEAMMRLLVKYYAHPHLHTRIIQIHTKI